MRPDMIYLYLLPPVLTRLLLSVPQKCQVLLAFPHAIPSPGPRFPTLFSDFPLPTNLRLSCCSLKKYPVLSLDSY